MKTRFTTLLLTTILIAFIKSPELSAQQVYPVAVQGMTLPPYSLNLEDYGLLRPEDLTFTVNLNDPVEESREVLLRLSVLHNGTEIMFTDPNFRQNSIEIFRLQPEFIDGNVLRPYLQSQHLVNTNGGRGGAMLPEGNNQICLEIIDRQRNVIISNRGCTQPVANFQRSLPPQLRLPVNRAVVPVELADNLIFNWTPKQIVSANPPGSVEYRFTMIEMIPGIVNPNDAFEQGFPVYEEVLPMPSFIYDQSLPPLEIGKLYAWRVQARSTMGYDLFENEGWSEVFVFQLREGAFNPFEPTAEASASGQFSIDRNCAPFSVDFGPVRYAGKESAPLKEGDKVNVGFFEMEVTQINSQVDGFSGRGIITVPFLRSRVGVRFRNVKVNRLKRVYEVGSIIADRDNPQIDFEPELLTEENIPEIFNPGFVATLSTYLRSRAARYRYISRLSESDPALTGLPLVLDKEGQNGRPLPPVIVLDLRFGVREAQMTGLSLLKTSSTNDPLTFLAPKMGITPYGIQQGSDLSLVGSAYIPVLSNMGLNAEGNQLTSLSSNCEGFADWDPAFSLAFDRDFLRYADSTEQVILSLSETRDQMEDLVAGCQALPPVFSSEIPGFRFQATGGKVDFSLTRNLMGREESFLDYPEYEKEIWRGVHFLNSSLHLPTEYDFSGFGQSLLLNGSDLFIDDQGLTGHFSGKDLVDIRNGKLGDWPCSIDQLTLDIQNSRITESQLQGQMKVPIMTEAFAYEATINLLDKEGDAEIKADLRGISTGLTMWNATMTLGDRSHALIVLRRLEDGQKVFIPSADLYGSLSLDLTEREVEDLLPMDPAAIKNQLSTLLGTNNLSLKIEDLEIQGLNFDPSNAPTEQFQLKGYNTSNARLTFGGQVLPIHAVQVKQHFQDGKEEVGLIVTMVGKGAYLRLLLWGSPTNEGSYSLSRIEFEELPLTCRCVDPTEQIAGLSDFPINKQGERILLTIPFLKELKLEMTGDPANQLKADWMPRAGVDIKELENWIDLSAADFDQLLATPLPGENTWGLPYDLTPLLPEILGIEDYQLPAGNRLILVGLEISDAKAEADLLLLTKIEERIIPFLATGVSMGPHSLGLKDLQLILPEEKQSQMSGLPITFHTGSIAAVSCNGFSTFRVNATCHIDEDQLIASGNTQPPLALNFIIEGQDLSQFIAPINIVGDTTAFVVKGGEGQIFHLKNGFVDLSYSENAPGMPMGYGPSFGGLFFKELQMEIQGFREYGATGGPLLVPAQNFIFRPGRGLGLSGEILLNGYIDEKNALELGEWILTMDRLRYRVSNNTVEQRQINGRLRLPRSPDRPWIGYQLQLGYNLAAMEPQAQVTIDDPALQSYVAYEGISNYAFTVLLSEDQVFTPILKVNDQPATFDYCLQFEGSQSFVQIEGANVIYPSYTKEAWIYLEPGPGNNSIMAGQNTSLAVSQSNDFLLSAGHNGEWSIVKDTEPLLLNTWYHVAVSYEASTQELRLYRDGELVGLTTAPPHSEIEQYIGGQGGIPDFNGRINEIRIWKTARSATEIRANRNLEIDPKNSDLVVYYRIDEGPGNEVLKNRTGSGYPGRMVNMNPDSAWSGTIAQNTTGISGLFPVIGPEDFQAIPGANYAIQFDGYDDRISLGRRINLYDQSFTIECWARQSASTGKDQLLAGQGFEAQNKGLSIGFRADSRFVFGFYKNDLLSPRAETGSNWHHWACVYDAEAAPGEPNRFLYRDGQLVASDHSISPFQGRGTFFIGTGLQPGLFFNGAIDEFRIWQTARNATEIQQGINQPLYGFEPGLLAHYPMNEGTGSRLIQDQSGRGNVGALEQIDLLGSWIIASLPILYADSEEVDGLKAALGTLIEEASKAKEKALNAREREGDVEASFGNQFFQTIDFATHRADSAIQLAITLLEAGMENEALRKKIEEVKRLVTKANLAAQDASDLTKIVQYYRDQSADYIASWDEVGRLSIHYRNALAYQQVKYLMTTQNAADPMHWNRYYKNNYRMEYIPDGDQWKMHSYIKGFPFPDQTFSDAGAIRLIAYDGEGKTTVYEAEKSAGTNTVPLVVVEERQAMMKFTSSGLESPILLHADRGRYGEKPVADLSLDYENGAPAWGPGLIVVNARQEQVIYSASKKKGWKQFEYTSLQEDGNSEEVTTPQPSFRLKADQAYIALLKDEEGQVAFVSLDSSFWNRNSVTAFSPFRRPEEIDVLMQQELTSRFTQRQQLENRGKVPNTPVIARVEASGENLVISWYYPLDSGDSINLELYRRNYDQNAEWALINVNGQAGEQRFTDTRVQAGQVYEYALQAQRPDGLASGFSQTATGQPAFNGAAFQIENFTIKKGRKNSVQMNWEPLSVAGVYEIQVYRSFGNGPLVPYVRLNGLAQEFADPSPRPGALHNYAVQIVWEDGRKGEISQIRSVQY